MTAKILPLPGIQAPAQPIAHYLRIGHTGYRELETLLENGRLLARRVVVSASKLKFQKERLSHSGCCGSTGFHAWLDMMCENANDENGNKRWTNGCVTSLKSLGKI